MQDTKKTNTVKYADVSYISDVLGYDKSYISLVLAGKRPAEGEKAKKILSLFSELTQKREELRRKFSTKTDPVSLSEYEDYLISKH